MELQRISPLFARVRSGKKEGRKSLTYPYNYQGMRDRMDRSSGR